MIFQADVNELVESGLQNTPLVAGSAALVYADTLYGTGNRFEHYSDTREEAIALTSSIFKLANRVLRPGGSLIIQCDQHLNYVYRKLFEDSSYFEFLNEIIWAYNSGGASKDRVPHKHDTILVGIKGGAPHTFNVLREPYPRDYGNRPGFNPEGRMQTSVWSVPRLSNTAKERTGYSTEKPPALIERIVKTFTNEGDLVYDPCCGSGASGVAALACGRSYQGSDKNPEAVEIAKRRLRL